ncbi:CBS domain-containing protein [Streptomyces sp. 900105755]
MYGTPHLVGDIMTSPVASVGRWASFKDVVDLMHDRGVSALPVLAGAGRVVGVVSEADLLPTEELRDSPEAGYALLPPADVVKAGAVTAGDLMTSPAITVRPNATLPEAARVMARKKVKRLPVVDEHGLLTGVVSRGDLLKVFLREDDDIAREIRRDIIPLLFPSRDSDVCVDVHDGVVTLRGETGDTSLVPVAARLLRAVDGVVDVDCVLTRKGQLLQS